MMSIAQGARVGDDDATGSNFNLRLGPIKRQKTIRECDLPLVSSVGVGTCFSISFFWLHVAAVTITVAIIDWPEFDVLLMAL